MMDKQLWDAVWKDNCIERATDVLDKGASVNARKCVCLMIENLGVILK